MIHGDGFEQRANGLTAVEEDFANLLFFDDQESGGAAVNWFDYEESAEATGWLDDQPDVVEESQLEQSPAGAGILAVAGRAGSQITLPESGGTKNFAQNRSILNVGKAEQQTALTQVEQEKIWDSERIRKAKVQEVTESAVCTKTEDAAGMWAESTESTNIL